MAIIRPTANQTKVYKRAQAAGERELDRSLTAAVRKAETGGGAPAQQSGALRQRAGQQTAQTAQTAVTPAQMKDYLAFGNPSEGFKAGMSPEDQAAWRAIGAKYAAGDASWNRDTDGFREKGNWGSYYDADGNINGWLYAADGLGGYAPVFGGKVGESGYRAGTVFYAPDGNAYTMGADGSLTKSGSVTWAGYGEYIGPTAGYHGDGGSFWSTDEDGNYRKYGYADAPDEVLEREGYFRRGDAVIPISEQYRNLRETGNGESAPALPARAADTSETGALPGGGSGSKSRGDAASPSQKTPGADTDPAGLYQAYLQRYDRENAPAWAGSDYERRRDEALESAREMRWEPEYLSRRDAALEAAGQPWEGGDYERRRDAALQRAEDLRWDYDPDADPVWQAYQKQYRREGRRAAQEALGQYAAMTGGVPSSYAVTAASQAGDYYASRLSDKLPEVYGDAYDRYLRDYQRQLDLSDRYAQLDKTEYDRWADRQDRSLQSADRYEDYDKTDYARYLDRYDRALDAADRYDDYGEAEYGRYRDRLDQWNRDRAFRYELGRDAVEDARYADETAYDRDYRARRDALSDERYEREQAQKLREYADSQAWKQTEWQQYLREYTRQLLEEERRRQG